MPRLAILLVVAALAAVTATAAAADGSNAPMMEKRNAGMSLTAGHDPSACAPDGVGAGGYDLISYRQRGGPRPGSPEFLAEYQGLRYLFVSADNRRQFLAEPERYLPAYGGWCATTLALGQLMCPDPKVFKIEDDRLLLFEVTGFTNGRTLWDTDPVSYRRKADANFETLNIVP